MRDETTYAAHARAVMALGLPLAGGHLAAFAIRVVDTVMLGWYGIDELAAVVLAGGFFFVLFIMGGGFAMAVMPMVARAEAEGDAVQVRRVTRMGLWLSLGYAVVVAPVMLWGAPILEALGQAPDLSELAGAYLAIALFGMAPELCLMVLRSYLSALERARIVLVFTIVTAVLNGVLNWAFIFGNLGAPEMGLRGAALASVLAAVIGVAITAIYAVRAFPEHALFQRFWRPDPEALARVFRLGWPIGVTLIAEVGLFNAAAILVGLIGKVELAAHGIALQISSATFLVHLGLSNAGTIRAGQAVGRGDAAGLRRGALVVSVISLFWVAATVAVFLAVPEPLMGAFLDPADPQRGAVIAVGAGLLAIAALFQLADAGQVVTVGLLRGMEDTRVPMLIAAFSYWGVGLPASWLLGFPAGLGAQGIWLGLTLGLAVAWLLLGWRFWGGKARIGAAGQLVT